MKTGRIIEITLKVLIIIVMTTGFINAQNYKIVDTGQKAFYNNTSTISKPSSIKSYPFFNIPDPV
jgi:hypothetical protein